MSADRTRAVVSAVASYLPEARLTNADLIAEIPGWTEEKIESKTGIRSRRIADSADFTSDLAVRACEAVFAQRPDVRDAVDFLVLVTVTPDYLVPFTASSVQTALGLSTDVGALDVLMGCSGYVYGLSLAGGLVESGRANKVLLITADRFTPMADEAAPGTKVLFGDAATATLVEASNPGATVPGGVLCGAKHGTDGEGASKLLIPTSGLKGFVGAETTEASKPTVVMNGSEVFDFTLRRIGKHVRAMLAENELSVDDVDLFVFHQANLFMMDHLRRRLRIPEERFMVYLDETGNTASSTIPLALERALLAGRVQPGQRVLLVGFGMGYSWASMLLEYPEA